jgi:hypothetical protein
MLMLEKRPSIAVVTKVSQGVYNDEFSRENLPCWFTKPVLSSDTRLHTSGRFGVLRGVALSLF